MSHWDIPNYTISRGNARPGGQQLMTIMPEVIVRRYIEEMWGEGRIELVDELVHEDYRPDGQTGGREFVRRNMRRFRTGFPDHTLRILSLVADGDRVAVLFEHSGTHLGVFGGIPPTGKTVRFQESGFFTVADEQVLAADWVSDGLGLRIQLGVLPDDFWSNPHR
jgi:predicted ester cyclase